MTTREFLGEVRNLIDAGWIQGTYRRMTPDGRVQCCLVGACQEVLRSRLVAGGQFAEAYTKIEETCLADGSNTIVGWNDAHGRTKDEVLALLDGVIAGCQEET